MRVVDRREVQSFCMKWEDGDGVFHAHMEVKTRVWTMWGKSKGHGTYYSSVVLLRLSIAQERCGEIGGGGGLEGRTILYFVRLP